MESKVVRLDKKAEKELAALFRGNRPVYEKVKEALFNLQNNPYGGKPLVGDKKGCYRIRVGDYRIIYEVAKKEIWTIKIGHRKDIYR